MIAALTALITLEDSLQRITLERRQITCVQSFTDISIALSCDTGRPRLGTYPLGKDRGSPCSTSTTSCCL